MPRRATFGKSYKDYEDNNMEMPVATVLGHHPAYHMGACYSGPFEVSEYDVIGGYLGEPLRLGCFGNLRRGFAHSSRCRDCYRRRVETRQAGSSRVPSAKRPATSARSVIPRAWITKFAPSTTVMELCTSRLLRRKAISRGWICRAKALICAVAAKPCPASPRSVSRAVTRTIMCLSP